VISTLLPLAANLTSHEERCQYKPVLRSKCNVNNMN